VVIEKRVPTQALDVQETLEYLECQLCRDVNQEHHHALLQGALE
jgi:hypothetical protein